MSKGMVPLKSCWQATLLYVKRRASQHRAQAEMGCASRFSFANHGLASEARCRIGDLESAYRLYHLSSCGTWYWSSRFSNSSGSEPEITSDRCTSETNPSFTALSAWARNES